MVFASRLERGEPDGRLVEVLKKYGLPVKIPENMDGQQLI
jgi:hypothetical protein